MDVQAAPDSAGTLRSTLHSAPFQRPYFCARGVEQQLDFLTDDFFAVSIQSDDLISPIHIEAANNRLPLGPLFHHYLDVRVSSGKRFYVLQQVFTGWAGGLSDIAVLEDKLPYLGYESRVAICRF